MFSKRVLSGFFFAVCLSTLPLASGASDPKAPRPQNRAEVEARLADNAAFRRLTVGGQAAVLDSLQFWGGGLRRFDALPLTMELSRPDMEALFDVLGMPDWKDQPFVKNAPAVADPDIQNSHAILAVLYRMSVDFGKAREADALVTRSWHAREIPLRFSHWLKKPLADLTNNELLVLHRVQQEIVFYGQSAAETRTLARFVEEKRRRNQGTDREIRDLHDAFLVAHLFPDAQKLAGQYPALKLPAPPEIHDATPAGFSGPTVLRLTETAALQRSPVDLGEGFRLVAVVHPHCHFSADFTKTLAKDEALRTQLKNVQPLFLMAQREDPQVDAAREWNQQQPDLQYVASWNDQDWVQRGVSMDGTPNFFLLHKGVLVDKVEGWREGSDSREKLLALLAKAEKQPSTH